jgi:uncharacterized protein (DUF1501 family)
MQRRTFLLKTAGLATLSFTGIPSAWANDAADTPRVLYVLLRGGMDGLTAVPPIGDRDYDQIRPTIGIQKALRLNADFGLHPALGALHRLWGEGHLAVVHSTGFGYTGRSHFEGQDVMQTGIMTPYAVNSGWIGRGMERAAIDSGVAISIPMPLILRGNTRATTDFPNWMPMLRPTDTDAVKKLWANEPLLAPFTEAIQLANDGMQTRGMGKEAFEDAKSMRGLARVAAAKMREVGGPRVGLIDMRNGFDTHASQGAEKGGHADRLRDLDALVASFKEAIGDRWAHSLIVTVTEFGRTAAENGTTGTDHGVGTCCFLAGGLVTESKVYADWRGLEKRALFEERDLPATIDINAVYAKVLERSLALSPTQITSGGVLDFKPHPALNGLFGLG